MSITINIYYKGHNGSARKFAEEMESSGLADAIRAKEGYLRYDYFYPAKDSEIVLLIDSWANQEALDEHHRSSLMKKIVLREKYDLHMVVERYIKDQNAPFDKKYIRD